MAYLLFHGRHITHTAFQEKYLWDILNTPVSKLPLFGNVKFPPDEKITHVVFAITSANKSNSRYNPLPFHLRVLSVDRFFEQYREKLGLTQIVVGIPHFDPTDRYVDILTKEIKEAENISLTRDNTIVLCSTESLIDLYHKEGYVILTAEFDINNKKYIAPIPVDVVKKIADSEDWQTDEELKKLVPQSTLKFWHDFSDVPKLIKSIWHLPILNESGSLTDTRNYSTYAAGMNNEAMLDVKYNDIKDAISPGRIVDEGCADGALITKIVKDFPDSDVIGIEITSEFLARCHERERAGEFGKSFVFFHQRDLMKKIFENDSIDTVICNSTTHEIWSYGEGFKSLEKYLSLKYDQLSVGGHLIIRDVIGPDDKEKEVYVKLRSDDGSDDKNGQINGLSTEARFYRFANDFLNDMRKKGARGDDSKIKFREEVVAGQKYFVMRLKDAVEFIAKKDYFDNWNSEMNEEFAFFSFSDWKELLTKTGFKIIENENKQTVSSHVYINEWIVKNRFIDKVTFYEKKDGALITLDYPPTNMVIIAEK